jgi:L-ribulose-5-phosphate 3-epimerase
MTPLKLGIHLPSLGLPLRRGLAEIERLGVTGVQLDATGDLAPRRLSQTGRREFLHLLRAHNLEVAALACPLRHGLDTALGQEGRIEYLQAALSLSYDLGARVITVQAGRVPEDRDSPQARLLTEALLALGHHGDRTGTILALETGLESGAELRQFLDQFDTGGLGVNFDPANLLLNGFDPYETARALAGRLAHCQARDARRSSTSRASQEVPLGSGDVDWMQFVAVLQEVEYRSWLTVC